MDLVLNGKVLGYIPRNEKKNDVMVILSGLRTVRVQVRKSERDNILKLVEKNENVSVPVSVRNYEGTIYFVKRYDDEGWG